MWTSKIEGFWSVSEANLDKCRLYEHVLESSTGFAVGAEMHGAGSGGRGRGTGRSGREGQVPLWSAVGSLILVGVHANRLKLVTKS